MAKQITYKNLPVQSDLHKHVLSVKKKEGHKSIHATIESRFKKKASPRR